MSITREQFAALGMDFDDEQWGFIVSSGDLCRAASEHAAPFDNTDALGLHFSTRLEQLIAQVMTKVRANEWHFVQFDHGKHWSWCVSGDTTDYSEAAGKGAILGIVGSHMLRRSDQCVYVIEPGSIPRWLEYVDTAGWRSCVVCKGRRFPDNEVVAARAQWLYELPVCSTCLKWLRAES